MRRYAMPLQIDIGVRRTVVVVESWHVEVDGDGSTIGRSVVCPFDLVVPDFGRINRPRPAVYRIDEVLVGIAVVPRNAASLSDGEEVSSEIIFSLRNSVCRRRRKAVNMTLHPDDALHRQWEVWQPLLGRDTIVCFIPRGLAVVEVVVETGLREGK